MNVSPQPGHPGMMRAPYAGAPAPPAAPLPPWRLGELFEIGWRGFVGNWAVLLFAPIFASTVAMVPGLLCFALFRSNVALLVTLGALGLFASSCILLFFSVGLTRIAVAAARGDRPAFVLLFSGGPVTVPYILSGLIVGVLVEFGTLAFVAPGVMLLAGFVLTPFFIVEESLGPLEAMRASWEATRGHKGRIAVFLLASAGAQMLGSLAFGIGSVVAQGVTLIGLTTIYTRLRSRSVPQPSQVPMAPPPPQMMPPLPPPGYGVPHGYGR